MCIHCIYCCIIQHIPTYLHTQTENHTIFRFYSLYYITLNQIICVGLYVIKFQISFKTSNAVNQFYNVHLYLQSLLTTPAEVWTCNVGIECGDKSSCTWRKLHEGVLCYVKDYSHRSYYLRLYDIEVRCFAGFSAFLFAYLLRYKAAVYSRENTS